LREQVSDAITSMLSSMDEARKAQPRPLWRKVLGARKH
jgi:hypothetical protein